MTPRKSGKLRPARKALGCIAVALATVSQAIAGAAQNSDQKPGQVSDQAPADAAAKQSSNVSYCESFFAQYPNATTVLDIVNRIPAGQRIIQSANSGARGFATNDDRILINGKRLTGKTNDSEAALERITIDQVGMR